MSATAVVEAHGAGATVEGEGHTMQCMEVWGGNQKVENAVSMAGLEAWVYSRPYGGAEEGGGDVYYVSSCATGRITRLLIADVSGHGSAVCDVAGVLRGLMRRYVNFIDQTKFVRSMNSQFTVMSAVGCFATAVVTTFYGPTGHMSLCNAGHPPPLMFRARTGEWGFLEQSVGGDVEGAVSNVPLGILDLADYEQFEVPLEEGDLVVCYTDSLIESRGRDGELLGTEGLLRIVKGLGRVEAGKLVPALLEAIAKEHAGNLEEDDVTVLAFRSTAGETDVPFWKRVAAPWLVIKGFWEAMTKEGVPAPWPEMSVANIGGAVVRPLGRLWRGRGR